MPLTLERTFRVRYTECDSYGHANNATYFRYMQESAFDATAQAGYPYERYQETGFLWLAYENEIEYLSPLRYNDSVTVKTWVADFRRTRSRRMYEMRRTENGEIAARASTDWVYLNSESLRPARIPSDMMAAFFPEGVPDEAPRRPPFPSAPPPPPEVFSVRRRVEWRDIDMAGHVNNAVYLSYIDDCGMQVCKAHGWPESRMREVGFGIITRQHRIEYKLPALHDDEIEVSTYAYGMRKATGTRYYTITRPADGALLAQAHTRYVWIDLATNKPRQIPEEFISEFATNITTQTAS